jgi:hypothetical protein
MLHMLLFEQIDRFEIPETLAFRSQLNSVNLFVIVSVCFVLIAVSKMVNGRALSLSKLVTNLISEKSTKQVIRLNSLSSVLMLINYFISLSLAVYLFASRGLGWTLYQSLILGLLLPVFVFLIEVGALVAVQWLSNERKKIHPAIVHTFVGYQVTGVFFALLNLFWLVNAQLNHFFMVIFLIIVAFKYLIRITKNSFIVLSNGAPLYYIILYFCTLEILPMLIVYIYIWKNFLN